jgi:hypothetical protein
VLQLFQEFLIPLLSGCNRSNRGLRVRQSLNRQGPKPGHWRAEYGRPSHGLERHVAVPHVWLRAVSKKVGCREGTQSYALAEVRTFRG